MPHYFIYTVQYIVCKSLGTTSPLEAAKHPRRQKTALRYRTTMESVRHGRTEINFHNHATHKSPRKAGISSVKTPCPPPPPPRARAMTGRVHARYSDWELSHDYTTSTVTHNTAILSRYIPNASIQKRSRTHRLSTQRRSRLETVPANKGGSTRQKRMERLTAPTLRSWDPPTPELSVELMAILILTARGGPISNSQSPVAFLLIFCLYCCDEKSVDSWEFQGGVHFIDY